MQHDKAFSSLIGGALGDALGYSREFVDTMHIEAFLPNNDWRNANFRNTPNPGRHFARDGKALISDDTQMTIATGRAMLLAQSSPGASFARSFAAALSHTYVTWSKHPDNTRAPGMACMRACRLLATGLNWQDATDILTMGCGANMRVAPIALAKSGMGGSPLNMAYLSSAITHAHPGALAATGLTVTAILAAYHGMQGQEILDLLLAQCESGYNTYPEDVLGDLWEQSEFRTPQAYMSTGYDLCAMYLRKADQAVTDGWKGETDPCTITGEGWTAPEALAGAMLCVAGLWESPVQVLQRAAVSRGDSDSLAAIAGNIRGAAGVDWPRAWVSGLETAPVRELRYLAQAL